MDNKQVTGIVIAAVLIIAAFAGGFFIGNNGNNSGGGDEKEVIASIYTNTAGSGYVIQNFTEVPERVACGCSTFLNIMLYFGLEDKIVGLFYDEEEVADEYKAAYDKVVKRIGEDHVFVGNSDCATVTSWEPDLIVGWSSGFKEGSIGEAKYWNDLDCNVWALESMCGAMDIESMIYDYVNLGHIFGIEEKVDKFLKTFINKLGEVKGILAGSTVNVAMYDSLGSTDLSKGLWMYGNDTFAGVILEYVGANNLFKDAGYGGIPLAEVIDKADQIDLLYFVCYGGCDHDTNYAAWTSDPNLAACPAIVNGDYHDIWLSLAYGGDPAVLKMLDNIEDMFS
jgi:ABC-type Fe3+-hydroxamate transport system substrate-binding protein